MRCNNDKNDIIPYAYVNITIDLQDPEFLELTSVSGRIMVTGGYNDNGIVIYRSSLEEFTAFDRTCTHEINDSVAYNDTSRVYFDDNSIVSVKCPTCKSQFELNYGSVTKGPAKYPLKLYKTSFNGNYLRVYN